MVWVGFHVHENGVWGSEKEKKGGLSLNLASSIQAIPITYIFIFLKGDPLLL